MSITFLLFVYIFYCCVKMYGFDMVVYNFRPILNSIDYYGI
nr:MAG TPA: hypothetical protein [Caudoviricetes sp.]